MELHPWHEADIEWLKQNYASATVKTLVTRLPYGLDPIRKKASSLKLKRSQSLIHKITDEDKDYLVKNFYTASMEDILKAIPISWVGILAVANEMGLKISSKRLNRMDKKLMDRLGSYRKIDAEKGFVNNLTFLQFKPMATNEECWSCGILPDLHSLKLHGADRIDNSLGHTKENCQAACRECNVSRNDKTVDRFFTWLIGVFLNQLKKGNPIFAEALASAGYVKDESIGDTSKSIHHYPPRLFDGVMESLDMTQ